MKFIHLTDTPFTKFKKPRYLGKDFKPHGVLWLAKGNAWRDFVKENEWEERIYEQEFEIDMSKIIELKTYKDIKDFNDIYGIKFPESDRTPEFNIIDWNKVRKDGKSGIYIKDANIKKARNDFLWYSSFDVECVAIWDSDCIIKM